MVVVLAGLRHPRRGRPLRPDRAESPVHGGHVRLRRQAFRLSRKDPWCARRTAERRAAGRDSLQRRPAQARRPARRGGVAGVPRQRRSCAQLRGAAVRPSALHHVFVRHDRRAEMHRAWRRRNAAATPQGTGAAHRLETRGPLLLLHDLRLDDVELVRVRSCGRRDLGALRRLALAPGRQRAVGPRRRSRHQRVRHQCEVDFARSRKPA